MNPDAAALPRNWCRWCSAHRLPRHKWQQILQKPLRSASGLQWKFPLATFLSTITATICATQLLMRRWNGCAVMWRVEWVDKLYSTWFRTKRKSNVTEIPQTKSRRRWSILWWIWKQDASFQDSLRNDDENGEIYVCTKLHIIQRKFLKKIISLFHMFCGLFESARNRRFRATF